MSQRNLRILTKSKNLSHFVQIFKRKNYLTKNINSKKMNKKKSMSMFN